MGLSYGIVTDFSDNPIPTPQAYRTTTMARTRLSKTKLDMYQIFTDLALTDNSKVQLHSPLKCLVHLEPANS